jgi:serine/threonine-protein kinase
VGNYPPSRAAVALSSRTGDSEESREFLQQRLALFGRAVGLLSLIFLVVGLGIGVAMVGDPWPVLSHRPNLLHLLATALLLGLWLINRRGRHPAPTLLRLDTGFTVAAASVFGAMGNLPVDVGGYDPVYGIYTAILAASNTVVFRAIAVPSSPRRTALISAGAMLPVFILIVVNLLRQGLGTTTCCAMSLGFFMWCALPAVVATVASRIIFGLRRDLGRVRQLGQYALVDKIGEGGMGVVYRARHAMLRRPTAIKLLNPARAGEENIRRFEREVQLTAELTHPNTVAIYDYGRTPDGLFYYAMEFLDGVDLQKLVRDYGAQPYGRVVQILVQVCGALDEAHEIGLIHRDIKPANVILCERGRRPDVAKVVDFGLVKPVSQSTTDSLSTADAVVGTPLYLSPESIRGQELDPRSDLYALGCVAYFLLAGAPVFDGDSAVEVCGHHLHSEPAPLREQRATDVPAELEQIIMDCLAKPPADRPGSAAELARRLRQVDVGSSWTRADAVAFWERHRRRESDAGHDGEPASPLARTVAVDLGQRS